MKGTINNLEILLLLVGAAAVELLLTRYVPGAVYFDLPLLLTTYVGWRSNPVRGAVTGTLFGLTQDALYRMYLGYNGLSKTLIGFAAGHLQRWIQLEGIVPRMICLALLVLMDGVIIYVLLSLLGQPVRQRFWWDTGMRCLVTGSLGVIFFGIYDRLKFPAKDFRRLNV